MTREELHAAFVEMGRMFAEKFAEQGLRTPATSGLYAALNDRDAVALLRYHAERIKNRCETALGLSADADVLIRLYSENELLDLIAITENVRSRMEKG